jgi:Tfp pilus assembly protein PilN
MRTVTLLAEASDPRIDLLPPEVLAWGRVRRLRMAFAAACLVAALVVGGFYLLAVDDVDDARQELDAVREREETLQEQVQAFEGISETYAQVTAMNALLDEAEAGEVRWSYYLNDLSRSIDDGVWLTTMTATLQGSGAGAAAPTDPAAPVDPAAPTDPGAAGGGIGTVTFTGSALSHDRVAAWLETLGEQPGYTDPYLTNSTERLLGDREVVDFTTDVVVTDAALWRNYADAAGE